MSIGKYRSRRNRAKPAAATIGAPLRGVFIIGNVAVNGPSGEALADAIAVDDNGNIVEVPVWTPFKIIDPKAIKLWYESEPIPVLSASVNSSGTRIDITFTPVAETVVMMILPGHPALVASNGAMCGGGVATG